MLAFDYGFQIDFMPFTFDGLKGLEHVKKIGLDSFQANYLALRIYRTTPSLEDSSDEDFEDTVEENPDTSTDTSFLNNQDNISDNNPTQRTNLSKVELIFRDIAPDTDIKGGDKQHFVTKYFCPHPHNQFLVPR